MKCGKYKKRPKMVHNVNSTVPDSTITCNENSLPPGQVKQLVISTRNRSSINIKVM
jgi:hypothetical protein